MFAVNENRWKLSAVDVNLCKFSVYDNELKKDFTYYVPKMTAVVLDGGSAIVHTAAGKNLLIKLGANSRRFIS